MNTYMYTYDIELLSLVCIQKLFCVVIQENAKENLDLSQIFFLKHCQCLAFCPINPVLWTQVKGKGDLPRYPVWQASLGVRGRGAVMNRT